jgi:methylthioribose-1-phosphate isomerase
MYCCDAIAQVKLPESSRDYSPANLVRIAMELIKTEEQMCQKMAEFGASLVKDGDNILTHCNTGSLATFGVGTALGVIRIAHKQGKKIHVYVDETRPLLQGGRLTAYELQKEGIPYTIICDNMAAALMRQGKVQRVFVGADRIAMNGDFANKIGSYMACYWAFHTTDNTADCPGVLAGTYSLAVVAKYHNVPFHTVAPVSTVDFKCETGNDIPIEERKREEVLGAFGTIWAPHQANTFNPAFDVTPGELVTSIILDSGIHTREMINGGSLRALQHAH